MELRYLIVAVIQLSLINYAFPQADTTALEIEVGLRGRWQTGNLKQLGINPHASISLSKQSSDTELQANYQLLKVNGFVAVSDFWAMGMHRFNPNKKVFPLISTNYGFAKSYKIEQSFLIGVGIGTNILNRSPTNFIQFHAFAGYLNFEFENENPHSVPALGSLLKWSLPIAPYMHLSWELHTYHSGQDIRFWGANNGIILHLQLFKNLSLSANHNTIFNNKTVSEIQKINTIMLFGIKYQYHKNLTN